MTISREQFLAKSARSLGRMYEEIAAAPHLELADLPADTTALIIVDMVNGFANHGPLSSPRVQGLIPAIVQLQSACNQRGTPVVAFGDAHLADSVEFASYGQHCVEGTAECDIVPEIEAVGGYHLIPKNSTNGFLEPAFGAFLSQNPGITNFIVVGDCTDICIWQFSTSLKADFNRRNKPCRVIVPTDAVETFTADSAAVLHNGDLMHLVALYSLKGNGIELAASVQ